MLLRGCGAHGASKQEFTVWSPAREQSFPLRGGERERERELEEEAEGLESKSSLFISLD